MKKPKTAASSIPNGVVTAAGDGGRPTGKEEPTTHDSCNVLKVLQDQQSGGMNVPSRASTNRGGVGNVAQHSRLHF